MGAVAHANNSNLLSVGEVVVSAGEERKPSYAAHKHDAGVEIRERLRVELSAVQRMILALVLICVGH